MNNSSTTISKWQKVRKTRRILLRRAYRDQKWRWYRSISLAYFLASMTEIYWELLLVWMVSHSRYVRDGVGTQHPCERGGGGKRSVDPSKNQNFSDFPSEKSKFCLLLTLFLRDFSWKYSSTPPPQTKLWLFAWALSESVFWPVRVLITKLILVVKNAD